MFRCISVTTSLLLLAACGRPTPTWEKDLKPLVEARCAGCHTTGGIAPFELLSYEQVKALKDDVKSAVVSRQMPPYLAGEGCTDYSDDQRLSTEEIELVTRWAEGGAPRGIPETGAINATPPPGLPRVDLTLSMPTTYSPSKSPDDYRCFIVDWPRTTEGFVTGFNVKPGNARVVHHVIAFLIQPANVQQVMDLDAAEAGPGYTCFGGPGGNNSRMGWLGSWAPGVSGSVMPEGTGIAVQPGSKVVLQVHYNTAAAPETDRSDLSAIELMVDDTVQKRAWIMPWADPDWIRKGTMSIPAGAADTEHGFQLDPTQYMSYLTANQVPNGQGFRMYGAGFHQHLLGTKGHLEINRADGSKECLLDVPRWDFHWQRSYRFSKPRIFHPGDTLGITCHWDNSEANQPVVNGVKQAPHDVNWGEGTGDEMCLGIFMISE